MNYIFDIVRNDGIYFVILKETGGIVGSGVTKSEAIAMAKENLSKCFSR